MDRALFLAARGRGRTAPNPMVGAVVVSPDGVVVGQGFHERAGEPHAEVKALEAAGRRARGATLYCTLEPCCHHGRTGPCAPRVVDSGIARVVAAIEDPYPRVRGQGFAYLREHAVHVDEGIRAADAAELNQAYLTLTRTHRPFVIAKAAASLDGAIAAAPGERTRLTSTVADRHAHFVRAEVDAIGVGSGTVLADDPQLTVRGIYRAQPLIRVIFDRRLRTPADAAVLSTRGAGPVIIVTTAGGAARADVRGRLEARGADIEVARDGSFRAALERLGARGIGSLLLEGGAGIHQAAWNEDAIDYVRVYVTPHVLGPNAVPLMGGADIQTTRLARQRVRPLGADVLIEGYVHGPH
jgi:diaminohydroxyphosphoribosylaminopyrimidine deaminase/5-amino-6-(5-phosphoribosylamino)uracil reductase